MEKLLIDCDPGHDDAVALFMAFAARDRFDVVGLTTVAGNIDVVQASRNARRVCAIASRADMAIHAGCSRPLVKRFVDASDYHGATGLDGLGEAGDAFAGINSGHAVDFLVSTLSASNEPVTLVCLAPLTNLAVALIKAPEIAGKIKEVVFMGGARRSGGNVTPCATFNLVCDPHAGHVVVESGVNLTIISLDATSQVVVRQADIARIAALPGAVPQASARILTYFNRRRMEQYGLSEDQCSLNDACVTAYLLDRSLFGGKRAHVSIEHDSGLTSGMSVVDLTGVTRQSPNALWIDAADSPAVLDLLHATLACYAETARS